MLLKCTSISSARAARRRNDGPISAIPFPIHRSRIVIFSGIQEKSTLTWIIWAPRCLSQVDGLSESIAVPVDAILDSGREKTVFVDRGDGMFEGRRVRTGWRSGERVQIVDGLTVGERIAVSGAFLLDSETRIRRAAPDGGSPR